MAKIITFGEIMLRLQPPEHLRFLQCEQYQALYGGGEANVAVSLANFGEDVEFVTKLPTHDIGQGAVNSLRRYGVGTGKIVRGGDRVGIYYIEKGASQRPSKVIYDRAGSSLAQAVPGDFDWEAIFKGADWFHFTGITPAVGGHLPQICAAACKAARKHGVTVSCDLNYRKKLWSHEEAKKTMTALAEFVDVCIANEEDAKDVFGIEAEKTNIDGGKLNHDGYKDVAEQLAKRFGFQTVAITLRVSHSASDNSWAGLLHDGREHYLSKSYPVHIVDRVGGGDSFAAGLIYSLRKGMQGTDALEFATAASCLKHTIEGDFNMVTVDEVNSLRNGDGSGRVQR